MEDIHRILFFWRSVIAYLTVLGVLLILLGIALAGWVTAVRKHEQKVSK